VSARLFAAFWLCLALVGQAGAAPHLRLIGTYQAPKGLSVDGALFGGVSGIDYDPRSGAWLMISDDRSDKAPARFYVARLDYDKAAVRGLTLARAAPLRRDDGSTFSPTASTEGERADAEAIRLDPLTGTLIWSSEGDRQRGLDPTLRRMALDGQPQGTIPLPRGLRFDPSGASGARSNLTLEGLSFTPDGRALWVSMEGPLVQDGPVASVQAGAWVRLTRLDRLGGVRGQYAYRLDPIQAAPAAGRRADNGVSEVLAVDQHRLLVLERSGVETAEGRFIYHCRLYLVDTRGARTVPEAGFIARPPRGLEKRLLINFDRLPGVGPSNLEAMAWGPPLAGGERTLVLASDDNFDPTTPGVILVFAVRAVETAVN